MGGRLAGSKPYYTLAVLDQDGKPTKNTYKLYSVTSIIGKVIAAPALYGWYYKVAVDGFSQLVTKYGGSVPGDIESIKSLMATEGLSPYKVRDVAGARGTAVHTDLENLCKGKVVKQTEANEGLLRWWETRNLTKNDILASELFLMSPKLGYAGTLDVVYVDPTDGATVLADLKTGYVSWTAFVQNNAYKDLADEQELFGGIDRVSVIHVRPVSEGKLMYGWEELVADTVTTETWRHILAIFNTLPVSIKEYQEDE